MDEILKCDQWNNFRHLAAISLAFGVTLHIFSLRVKFLNVTNQMDAYEQYFETG